MNDNVTDDLSRAYRTYWKRKQLIAHGPPRFHRCAWHAGSALCPIENVYFDAIRRARTVLDVGAGDLRMKARFAQAGFAGRYFTQDVGTEYPYDFADLEQAREQSPFDAIICLDVIEHLPLSGGLALLDQLGGLLGPGGVLIVQTPNARCVRHPLGWDMTHLHCYNLTDLWAYLTAEGMDVTGYRVPFTDPEDRRWSKRIVRFLGRWVITRLLGCDDADNIALVARRG